MQATITEQGNRFPSVGEKVYQSSTDTLYRILAEAEIIHTGLRAGQGNYMNVELEIIGDASDLTEEEFEELNPCHVETEDDIVEDFDA